MSATHVAGWRAGTTPDPRRLGAVLAWGALVGLALWAATPIVWLLVKAAGAHEALSGGESLFPGDQLQYLAWIRSSAEHLLAANDFGLREGRHVYLQPMFAISGLLWRAGIDIAVSYLLWLPVAVGLLYVGFRQFVWRTVPSPLARAAALIVALFFATPAAPLAGWTFGSNGLAVLGGELAVNTSLYGYLPVAIAVGLLALFMVGLDRVVSDARPWGIGWTTAAGMLASWIHPWQGETALIVVLAILVLGRFRRRYLTLLVPALGTLLPLVYYLFLSRMDAAWKLASIQSTSGRPNALLLIPALAPLVLLALPGARGPRPDRPLEWALWLWPVAALAVYAVAPQSAPHALEGVVLPLSVLTVRGWRRWRLPGWLGAGAIALVTLPGLVSTLQQFHDAVGSEGAPLLMRKDETDALAYLDHARAPGGVLPSLRIATAVPAYTGRRTWIGHPLWTPQYRARAYAVSAVFGGWVPKAMAQRFLRQAGARYLLADCESRFDPASLGPLLMSEHRYGCVAVYELRVPDRAAPV